MSDTTVMTKPEETSTKGTIVMPKLGMTMTEGTIIEWHKEIGDAVEQGEAVLTISSEKLNQELEAPIAGVLLTKNAEVDEELPVGAAICIIGEEGTEVGQDEKKTEPSAAVETATPEKLEAKNLSAGTPDMKNKLDDSDRIFITPLARKMAQDENLDITRIKGSGGNGRITKLDIQRVLADGLDYEKTSSQETETKAAPVSASANLEAIGEGLSPMRKVIAKNMRGSLAQTAQLTLHRKANVDKMIDFQKVLRNEIEASDVDLKLSLTVLIAKATVLALQECKEMNALYYDGGLTEYDEVHLGIATSLDDGLLVPVIENAHQKSIGTLAKDILAVTEKAKNGEASGDLLSGSTFTITNLGAGGIEYFTPILNTPEIGILGVGSFQEELALAEDGTVKSVKKVPFSLTFDHQILDGVTAANFLTVLVKYIESPYLLML